MEYSSSRLKIAWDLAALAAENTTIRIIALGDSIVADMKMTRKESSQLIRSNMREIIKMTQASGMKVFIPNPSKDQHRWVVNNYRKRKGRKFIFVRPPH